VQSPMLGTDTRIHFILVYPETVLSQN